MHCHPGHLSGLLGYLRLATAHLGRAAGLGAGGGQLRRTVADPMVYSYSVGGAFHQEEVRAPFLAYHAQGAVLQLERARRIAGGLEVPRDHDGIAPFDLHLVWLGALGQGVPSSAAPMNSTQHPA